jgi:uncharacterized protein (TIGR02611 family)
MRPNATLIYSHEWFVTSLGQRVDGTMNDERRASQDQTAKRFSAGWLLRLLRKVAVALVGGLVVVLGLALIVLPGPAVVVIPFGVAILATEFEWAQRLLLQIRALATRVLDRVKRRPRTRSVPLA